MKDLLRFEADCQTIQILANSMMVGGMQNTVNKEQERKRYMSKVGYLYPDRQEKLSNVNDIQGLKNAVDGTPYEHILK